APSTRHDPPLALDKRAHIRLVVLLVPVRALKYLGPAAASQRTARAGRRLLAPAGRLRRRGPLVVRRLVPPVDSATDVETSPAAVPQHRRGPGVRRPPRRDPPALVPPARLCVVYRRRTRRRRTSTRALRHLLPEHGRRRPVARGRVGREPRAAGPHAQGRAQDGRLARAGLGSLAAQGARRADRAGGARARPPPRGARDPALGQGRSRVGPAHRLWPQRELARRHPPRPVDAPRRAPALDRRRRGGQGRRGDGRPLVAPVPRPPPPPLPLVARHAPVPERRPLRLCPRRVQPLLVHLGLHDGALQRGPAHALGRRRRRVAPRVTRGDARRRCRPRRSHPRARLGRRRGHARRRGARRRARVGPRRLEAARRRDGHPRRARAPGRGPQAALLLGAPGRRVGPHGPHRRGELVRDGARAARARRGPVARAGARAPLARRPRARRRRARAAEPREPAQPEPVRRGPVGVLVLLVVRAPRRRLVSRRGRADDRVWVAGPRAGARRGRAPEPPEAAVVRQPVQDSPQVVDQGREVVQGQQAPGALVEELSSPSLSPPSPFAPCSCPRAPRPCPLTPLATRTFSH
ncbi:uncharacterized protein RHOBADRAFT_54976, partial [Rhodotorula graminis WP1]